MWRKASGVDRDGESRPWLRLLGPVHLFDTGGTSINLGGPMQRALLAWLAVRAPRSSSVDQIVDALWGESPPKSARNTVQVYVSRHRKALSAVGADVLRDGDGYRLVKGPMMLDIADFEQLVTAGRSAIRADESARAADLLSRAITMWRGRPFTGLDVARFVQESRIHLEMARDSTRLDLADSMLRTGRPDEAAAVARPLLEASPYDERVWSVLARAHYQAGRQAQALQTCRQARELLAAELGLDPGPALLQLEQQILNQALPRSARVHDTSIRPAEAVTSPAAVARKPPPLPRPMVGRAALVAEIRRILHDGTRLLTLVGLGGIGKTSVALAVAHQLTADGVPVVFSELETVNDPVIALDRISRDIGINHFGDPISALRSVGAQHCKVLILDNLEQIDDFAPALDEVLEGNDQLVILATARRAIRSRHERLALIPPLGLAIQDGSSAAIDLFLAHAARVRPELDAGPSMSSIAKLCDIVDGVPLAIKLTAEKLRVLTPTQLLARTLRVTSTVLDAIGPSNAPSHRHHSLRVVLAETIQMLPPGTQRVLSCAALMDGWAPVELLETLLEEFIEDDFLDSLDEVVVSGLVQLDDQGRFRLSVAVRDHVRATHELGGVERLFIDRIGQLTAEFAPRLRGRGAKMALAELGELHNVLTSALMRAEQRHHEAEARMLLDLHRYWLLSGRTAEGRRWATAAAMFHDLDPSTRVRMQLVAGILGWYLSHPGSVRELADAVAQADRFDLSPDWLLVSAWCCRGASAAVSGDFALAELCVQRSRELAARTGDMLVIAAARNLSGQVAKHFGDHATALEVALAGISEARHAGDGHDLVMLLAEASENLIRLDRAEGAWSLLEEALAICQSLPEGAGCARVQLLRAQVLIGQRQHEAGRRELVDVLRLTSGRQPDPQSVGGALGLLACIPSMRGDHEAAARLWGAADAIHRDNGVSNPRSRQWGIVGLQRARTDSALGPDAGLAEALGAADPERIVLVAMESVV